MLDYEIAVKGLILFWLIFLAYEPVISFARKLMARNSAGTDISVIEREQQNRVYSVLACQLKEAGDLIREVKAIKTMDSRIANIEKSIKIFNDIYIRSSFIATGSEPIYNLLCTLSTLVRKDSTTDAELDRLADVVITKIDALFAQIIEEKYNPPIKVAGQ